jgi:hypothetical protein
MASVNVDDKLYEDIKQYCKLNGLKIGNFINEILEKSFLVEKYGSMPPFFKHNPDTEPVPVDVKMALESGQTVEEFRERYLSEPEPVKNKKEKYIKPEVTIEDKPKEENKKHRIQYL